ncbi:C45 family autoproteolytic acyltransferase/hydolase [Alistipes sp.]|uniref:C45 family autoproteolytic acyltransferase/hydolase n=1 Tax=Alistipes sp. TaxID=1872444 RepID=UPI003AF7E3CC
MKRILKYTLVALAALLLLPAAFLWGLYLTADMQQPVMIIDTAAYRVTDHGGYTSCHGSFLRRNAHGVWELYTAGSPDESGAAAGALTAALMRYQEEVFVDQIRKFVPSDGYLRLLRGMILIFNRNLGQHVPEEYRREIYARSLYCSHDFDAIGTPYERQLNYHAAHDIGHAMSQYMLVGCSSFAAWGGMSADGGLIVGRNFDFYMGDDFARNRIVTFCRPQAGYPFASIGWAGMVGVLSGMNTEGLTVTINAAKGPLPLSSATPISILAREILQHAATIGEALAIAQSRDTFVSESLLIASARDAEAAIIEKTPRKTVLYRSGGEQIVCTNHYQSEEFADDRHNRENIAMTDSPYRFARLEELMAANAPLDVPEAVAMLRDQRGAGGIDIGVGNDCSVNQSIAHHSVVFRPGELKMWVSTAPWQGGAYVCYDLGAVMRNPDPAAELYDKAQEIPADTAYLTHDYPRLMAYREYGSRLREAMEKGEAADERLPEAFARTNPGNFHTWKLLGEYYLARGDKARAAQSFDRASEAAVPRADEREAIEKLKSECEP